MMDAKEARSISDEKRKEYIEKSFTDNMKHIFSFVNDKINDGHSSCIFNFKSGDNWPATQEAIQLVKERLEKLGYAVSLEGSNSLIINW